MKKLLEKRIRYFLTSRYRHRQYARDTLEQLQKHGNLVIIGGLLRDLCLFGNAQFRSDIDLVIYPRDENRFSEHMASVSRKVNRFGGYGLPLDKWQLEVWSLRKTWAHTAGHVQVNTFDDLIKTTFFNCDAITYDISSKRLSASDNYFADLESKLLEINLRPNPNPVGNAVRAMRYGLVKGFLWGPLLTRFVAETIDEIGWSDLVRYEQRSFHTRYIADLNCNDMEKSLYQHLNRCSKEHFDLSRFRRTMQMELFSTK